MKKNQKNKGLQDLMITNNLRSFKENLKIIHNLIGKLIS